MTTEAERWLSFLEGDNKKIENKETRDTVLITLDEMIMAMCHIQIVEYPCDRHKRMSVVKKEFRAKVTAIMGEADMLNLLGKEEAGDNMFSTCGDVSQ